MRRPLCWITAVWAFTFSQIAWAQDALDRVDPARVEERARDTARTAPATAPTIDRDEGTARPEAPAVAVGAIDLVGLEVIPRAHFADVIEPFLGRTLTADDLSLLVDRLANRARERFPLASARIEPQAMRAGVLQVRIDEGRVDAIEIEGVRSHALTAALQTLASGRPVRAADLEHSLLVAGDIDGITIEKSRIVREGGRNILKVNASRQRVRAQVTLDNDSTKPLGPVEVFGSLALNSVLSDGDSLQFFGLAAVPEVAELTFLRARYARRVAADGTEIALAGALSRTRPGAYLSPLRIAGDSAWASLGVLRPLARSRDYSSWVEASVAHRHIAQNRTGERVREDRTTVAKLRLFGNARIAGGTLRASGAVSQGLDLLSATRRGDPLSSRADADGTFTALWLSAQWTRSLAGKLTLDAGVRSQLASQPLLVAEEIGLGGAAFVRGYDYSERSGDRGTMGYAELRYAFDRPLGPVRGVQLYAFGDGGVVRNLQGDFGGGSLFSAGGGLRADVDRRTDAGLEIAVPLSGPRYDTGDRTPRLRFSLTRFF